VTDSQVEAAMATHAQACYSTMLTVGSRWIVTIDIRDQLFDHKGLITDGRIDRAVEPPAAKTAVGTDEDDPEVVRLLFQLGSGAGPLGIAAAIAMEEIDNGVG
jgi:hypothetical protein